MITPYHDNRIIFQSQSFECCQQPADLRVNVTDASVIAMTQVTCLFWRDYFVRWYIGISPQFTVAVVRQLWCKFDSLGLITQNKFSWVMTFPVFSRSAEGQMWFEITNRQEERLAILAINDLL